MKIYQKRIGYEEYSDVVYTENGMVKDKASYYDDAKRLANEYIARLTEGLNEVLAERKEIQPKFDVVTAKDYFEVFGRDTHTMKAKKKTCEYMERLNSRINHARSEINKLEIYLADLTDKEGNDLIGWFLKQEGIRYIEIEVVDG